MSFPSPAWADDLPGMLAAAWARLGRAAIDSKAPMRTVQLATCGTQGPRVRTVVPRAVRREAGIVEIHTDARAGKVTDLAHDPRAELVGWDARARLQVRLRMRVETILADEERWAALSDEARWNYGAAPPPGEPIPAPDAFARPRDVAGFAALVGTVIEMDTVLLDPAGHRRARFRREDGWEGAWLSP